MQYKYKMFDIECGYCANKGNRDCANSLCPHIMGNLSELFADGKFREAVKNAENCNTNQRNTLKYLKKRATKLGYDIFYEDKPFRCKYKPECENCSYGSPGFICYSKKDGTCLKDWIRSKSHVRICKQGTD